ncbi:UTP--glucose-1-phosphate uridylyltransferase family protein [Kipferlia bialata]|uniref:UTP--glucose-1-phosphate uridylyltransferase n=1 Tax=Kipferlia bialata TaxID=797122 RepID=A0A9K3GJE0_9EUKA|nr:UTP--glucose-1-phosphate uridylyltransferase family protein [Kipferlia bialata]|eukprot:g7831.t1
MEVDEFPFDIIVNKKEAFGKKVIQLEQAVSAAVSFFHSATLVVPRSRFVPVKTCRDLLLARSNIYSFDHGTPVASQLDVPIIRLGHHYKTVADFEKRFPCGVGMQGLVNLTVVGDVVFGEGCTCRGFVCLVGQEGQRLEIPANTALENVVINGSMEQMVPF